MTARVRGDRPLPGDSLTGSRQTDVKRRQGRNFLLLALLLLFMILISAVLGRFFIAPGTVIKAFFSRVFPLQATWPETVDTALFNIRLPRIAMAIVIGAGLSVAGSAFQAVFQNPMVSPDVLGASSGAGFGAALGILLGFGTFGISISAFVCGLLTILLVVALASRVKQNRLLGLILTGIIVSSLFTALLSLLKYMADPTDQLPAITYWLMGSLNSTNSIHDLRFCFPLVFLGGAVIFFLRWQLNVLTMGEESARSMGVETGRVRMALLIAATLITAACVAVSGMIGWIGLVIPHFSRLIVGSDHRYVLPASALIGSSFLLLVDNFARLLTTTEIPLGILTAFVGAPFFLYLIMREANV